MSGGYFDYAQTNIGSIADSINGLIDQIEYKPETIAKFRQAQQALVRAYKMAQRIDWLLSGDDSEDTFHQRWDEEGLGPELAAFYAYDQDGIDLYSHAADYRTVLSGLGDKLHSVEKYELECYKDTDELIDELRKFYYELRTQYHLPEY